MKIIIYVLCIIFPLSNAAFSKTQEKADRIVVEKQNRKMYLLHEDKIIKTYDIALGDNPKGHKEKQGDEKTPEGIYYINGRHKSKNFHRSLHISYPNEKDKLSAKKKGFNPGGDIMIHGLKKGRGWIGAFHDWIDWTDGCIAVTNDEIEEIWKLVPNNTPIEIKP